jgi:hypothetical protein
MQRKFFNQTRAGLAIFFLMAATSSSLYAIDSNNRLVAYGVGQRTCEDYIRFREKKLENLERQYEHYTKDELYDIVDRVIEQWMAGFLTAHNLYVSDTYDVVGGLTMDDLEDRLEKICRTNPKERFAEAMITLVVQELHPKRVRAEAGNK